MKLIRNLPKHLKILFPNIIGASLVLVLGQMGKDIVEKIFCSDKV